METNALYVLYRVDEPAQKINAEIVFPTEQYNLNQPREKTTVPIRPAFG